MLFYVKYSIMNMVSKCYCTHISSLLQEDLYNIYLGGNLIMKRTTLKKFLIGLIIGTTIASYVISVVFYIMLGILNKNVCYYVIPIVLTLFLLYILKRSIVIVEVEVNESDEE